MSARVSVGARLHFGFGNLSLAHARLYGGVGVGLAEPRVTCVADPAPEVRCEAGALADHVAAAVDLLGVEGATVRVEERFERHVGLGSGTQFALAALVAVARAHGLAVDPRARAPALGRGGRSGVGVATFERGGFVLDAGHPTERFTAAPPAPGDWAVPPVIARHEVPNDWRFLLVTPAAEAGHHGPLEESAMRAVVERADPGIADQVATVLLRRLLPAVATGDLGEFGRAVARLGRLNGAWYADEQGGVYRPPAGRIVEAVTDCPAVTGAGQSSWGPTVYGVTDAAGADRARRAGEEALSALGREGSVRVVRPRNRGAVVTGAGEGPGA